MRTLQCDIAKYNHFIMRTKDLIKIQNFADSGEIQENNLLLKLLGDNL